jgi:uncharacterized protein (DUF849 family)
MNEQDLRDCFAMFALCGYVSRMGCNPLERGNICEEGAFADTNAEAVAKASYIMADSMLEARKPQETVGLPAIKKRTRK